MNAPVWSCEWIAWLGRAVSEGNGSLTTPERLTCGPGQNHLHALFMGWGDNDVHAPLRTQWHCTLIMGWGGVGWGRVGLTITFMFTSTHTHSGITHHIVTHKHIYTHRDTTHTLLTQGSHTEHSHRRKQVCQVLLRSTKKMSSKAKLERGRKCMTVRQIASIADPQSINCMCNELYISRRHQRRKLKCVTSEQNAGLASETQTVSLGMTMDVPSANQSKLGNPWKSPFY